MDNKRIPKASVPSSSKTSTTVSKKQKSVLQPAKGQGNSGEEAQVKRLPGRPPGTITAEWKQLAEPTPFALHPNDKVVGDENCYWKCARCCYMIYPRQGLSFFDHYEYHHSRVRLYKKLRKVVEAKNHFIENRLKWWKVGDDGVPVWFIDPIDRNK